MAGRSYSDPSYGAHKTITFAGNVADGTGAAATNILGFTFLTPTRVLGGNITLGSAVEEDLSTSTNWLLAKSTDSGTGVTQFATNTAIHEHLVTTTWLAGEVLAFEDFTATNFSAGDSVWLQMEGTIGGLVAAIQVNLECKEIFVQSDS